MSLTLKDLISFLIKCLSGQIKIEDLEIIKTNDKYEVKSSLIDPRQSTFEEWEDDSNQIDNIINKINSDDIKSSVKSKEKQFHPFSGTLVVQLNIFNSENGQLSAKVIHQDKGFIGPKKVKLFPARGYSGWKLLAIACVTQIELRVTVFNEVQSGQSVFFVTEHELPQPDLFKQNLLDYLEKQ